MLYPSVLKKMALGLPVLGAIVRERDRLRFEVSSLQEVQRDLQEELRSLHDEKISVVNYCHCCRQNSEFIVLGSWLRDQYVCGSCYSIPRQRHIQQVLDKYFEGWEGMSIHESSPSNNLISRYCDSYSSSQFLEGASPGEVVNGVRSENLEALSFPDNSFDLFITQDVFEHILDPGRAAVEIMRVLKPGGAHVFTAPKHPDITLSYPRAVMSDGGVKYLLEPSYHGNPVGDGRALVTWDYGDDFEFKLHEWCGYPTSTYLTRDRTLGLDGEFLEVFVTRKPVQVSVLMQN